MLHLSDVTALYPQLTEPAGDFFQVLRAQVAAQTGWDALGNLENAYVPLTTPLDPGLGEDWLYTGRAFTLNPVFVQANWMVVVREDFGQQIYWRIYLRTAAQDGSQGMPLTQVPWDFSARTTSSSAYENGGQLMNSIPSGYWIDLTTLASPVWMGTLACPDQLADILRWSPVQRTGLSPRSGLAYCHAATLSARSAGHPDYRHPTHPHPHPDSALVSFTHSYKDTYGTSHHPHLIHETRF